MSRRKSSKRALRYRPRFSRLFAEMLEPRLLLTTVASVDPPANSHDAASSTDAAAAFDQVINGSTATPETFAVHSTQRGQLIGSAATVSTS